LHEHHEKLQLTTRYIYLKDTNKSSGEANSILSLSLSLSAHAPIQHMVENKSFEIGHRLAGIHTVQPFIFKAIFWSSHCGRFLKECVKI
jgi:hypothetical protein